MFEPRFEPEYDLFSRLITLFFLPLLLVACEERPDPSIVGRIRVRAGLEVQQVAARDLGFASDSGLLTLLYFDPARFELRLLTAAEQGEARSADRWLEDFGLVAVVNSSMYMPNHRSTGLMVNHERVNNPAVNPTFGGFLAFGSADPGLDPWLFIGEDCEGFSVEEIRRDYPVVVQNYRLLDCAGESITWTDTRSYSAAAIGRDSRGWLVMAHSGVACPTSEFARWLALPRFGLTDAHFVEGGPDASLMLRDGGQELRVIGSRPGVRPSGFRDVPNVLGVVARPEPGE
jgi:hypothetical protein